MKSVVFICMILIYSFAFPQSEDCGQLEEAYEYIRTSKKIGKGLRKIYGRRVYRESLDIKKRPVVRISRKRVLATHDNFDFIDSTTYSRIEYQFFDYNCPSLTSFGDSRPLILFFSRLNPNTGKLFVDIRLFENVQEDNFFLWGRTMRIILLIDEKGYFDLLDYGRIDDN